MGTGGSRLGMQEDGKVLNAALPLLNPIVSDSECGACILPFPPSLTTLSRPAVTNGVYAHLFRWDYTKYVSRLACALSRGGATALRCLARVK